MKQTLKLSMSLWLPLTMSQPHASQTSTPLLAQLPHENNTLRQLTHLHSVGMIQIRYTTDTGCRGSGTSLTCFALGNIQWKANTTTLNSKCNSSTKMPRCSKQTHQGILYASRRMHTSPYSCLLTAQHWNWITKTMGAGNHFFHLSFIGNAYHDVTTTCFEQDYNTRCAVVA